MIQFSKRTDKLALLSKIVEGRLSSKEIIDIRKGWEPMHITLNLGDWDTPIEQGPDEPTYHIEIYTDGTTKCYDRYPYERLEYGNS